MRSVEIEDYRIACRMPTLQDSAARCVISTVNAHSWVIAGRDAEFKRALVSSDVLLPDGEAIVLAAKVLAGEKIQKIAGADIHSSLLRQLDDCGGRCFYLGASQATLAKIDKRMKREYPNVVTESYSPPFRDEFSPEDSLAMIDAVNAFAPDVLFVGMTAPKQEKWVDRHKGELNVRLVCSVGAVFDFYAGTKRRPPQWMIRCKLEWFGRLLFDTRHTWRRTFFSIPAFLWIVFRLKVSGKYRAG